MKEKPAEKENEESGELDFSNLNLDSEELQKTMDSLEHEDSENFLKETKTDFNTCPNCKTKTEHLVFCPECGSAFCTHCAKQTKAIDDRISYTCPKCGTEFKARKTESTG